MALTKNQIIIGVVVIVVFVGVIIAAIVLSRPKDQTEPNHTTKTTTKTTTKPTSTHTTKPTLTPIVNIGTEIKIRTIKREITLPVFQGCWSSPLIDEYSTNITLPSNIKATPFRAPKGEVNTNELIKDIFDSQRLNMLVTCNNNVLSVLRQEDIFVDNDNRKVGMPPGILLELEEIAAGTTQSFFEEDKVIGFKFTKV